MISELMNQLDEPIDEDDAYEKVKPQDQNPLKIVLMQEISRYNKLLKYISKCANIGIMSNFNLLSQGLFTINVIKPQNLPTPPHQHPHHQSKIQFCCNRMKTMAVST